MNTHHSRQASVKKNVRPFHSQYSKLSPPLLRELILPRRQGAWAGHARSAHPDNTVKVPPKTSKSSLTPRSSVRCVHRLGMAVRGDLSS